MDKEKSTIRFLSFSNDKEDAEKEAKLKEAAAKIELAIARDKAIGELVDYNEPNEGDVSIDLKNDTRSLYERLMEQKNKKKEALEESQKLSNIVTKLDEDDASYLNEVARNKREDEIKKRLEVYDALEEKRRLDEKKMDVDEQKMKQFLIGGGLGSKGTSSLKAKLAAKIKIKPKNKSNQGEVSETIMTGQGSSTEQNRDEVEISSCSYCNQKTNQNSQKADNEESLKNRKSDDNEQEEDKKKRREPDLTQQQRCFCKPKRIMKCIGILPSLPQVKRKHQDSSDEDSDDSSDHLEERLVPRISRSRRSHH